MLGKIKRSIRKRRELAQVERSLRRPNDLQWRFGPVCPVYAYDAACAQIGDYFYLFGGYTNLSTVNDTAHVFDRARSAWTSSIELPPEFPNSHTAVAADGVRYIYSAGGQVGPQCRPACARVYCYDSQAGSWTGLPDLPDVRYAGTMQLWKGRLHFVGGAEKDRWTPCADHWSIAIENGRAAEEEWRTETPIPVPGMHRGSVLLNDSLYVIGGQQGDFVAMAGDSEFTCTGETREDYISECFRLDTPTGEWVRIADLPVAASHVDFQ